MLQPRVYHAYRAILLPDCALWSGDGAVQKAVATAWEGSGLAHPSVAEIRKRLAELPR
ncbi:MAG: hypothetical protein H0V17_14700 [Deltaproteobacteria bacterium]|nr:hypothetical protein [Deltaproteobacteria bacterium]